MQKIIAKGVEIDLFTQDQNDFISLTGIARFKDLDRSDYIIQNWMRSRSTIEFLGIWEQINNPVFKSIEFDGLKQQAGLNSFSLTPTRWIESVNAIGLINKMGRRGGTFAHKDIAFEFATWISPEFKLYLIKEFQRLKIEENERLSLGWDAKRMLTKINYKIHTDAINEVIVLPQKLSSKDATIVYATEADVLNKALFGLTAKEWRDKSPNLEGNMREYANVTQLVCLANLENLNAEYIREGLPQGKRLLKLNESAINQMRSLLGNPSVTKLAKIV